MTNDVTDGEPVELISAIIVRSGRVALVVGGPELWRAQPGYTLVPLELPGGPRRNGESARFAVARICREALGVEARMLTSRQIYGPTPTHRMDKLSDEAEGVPLPLLRFGRAVLYESSEGDRIRSLVVRAYLTRIHDNPIFEPTTCGALWSSPEALGALLRGIPAAAMDSLPRGVDWSQNPSCPLPPDAFFYVPSEYGERQLVRLIAKYGHGVLNGEEIPSEP